MSGIGATELIIIVGLVLAMGLFWGVVLFFVGWSLFKRRNMPAAPPQDPSANGPRPDDEADDPR